MVTSGTPEGGGTGVKMWLAVCSNVMKKRMENDFSSKLPLQEIRSETVDKCNC